LRARRCILTKEQETTMPEIGVPELLIVAFVVLLLFGPGKVADIGSSLGKGIREFRRESAREGNAEPPLAHPAVAAPAAARSCTNCGSQNAAEQKFCTNCGTAMAVAV
jgi:sec-independent protein translocase protein TatA